MFRKLFPWAGISVLAIFVWTAHGEVERLEQDGAEVVVDDGWFEGCYHNAFEGRVEKKEDGTLKAGEQGIQHTKGILTGAGSAHARMTLRFELDAEPTGAGETGGEGFG